MSKWTVVWQRVGEPDLLACTGLPPAVAIYRLRSAIKNSGSIIVHEVKHEAVKGGAVELDG